MFGFWDWTVLGLYLLLTAGMGAWFSRKNKNAQEFLFGGGKMPWYAVGLSLIATSVSATSFLGGPADVYGKNMTYLMLSVGSLLSVIFIGWIFIPRLRARNIESGFQLLEVNFSKSVKKLAASLYCLHLFLRSGVLLFGPALVLAQMLDVNLYLAILFTAILAIAYT